MQTFHVTIKCTVRAENSDSAIDKIANITRQIPKPKDVEIVPTDKS